MKSAAWSFRLTDDPMRVEILDAGDRVIGFVAISDASIAFSKDVWRWRVEIDNVGSSSGGGYLQVPKPPRPPETP
jgi:hypothetical protein